MNHEKAIGVVESVESLIRLMRGQRVILDADLARVYGVPTKQLNQAVKRNLDRFPDDFAFQLDNQEVAILRSQFVTSSSYVEGDMCLMLLPSTARLWRPTSLMVRVPCR